jgi:hypothetical protein
MTRKYIYKVCCQICGGRFAFDMEPYDTGYGYEFVCRRWIYWHVPYHLQFFSIRSIQLAEEKRKRLIGGGQGA